MKIKNALPLPGRAFAFGGPHGGSLESHLEGAFEPHLVWDKFHIYQSRRFIGIGEKPPLLVEAVKFHNPIRQALWYKQLLEGGQAEKQDELAQQLGVSRSRIASVLRLLNLDEEIREFLLSLDENDARLKRLTERRLRPLLEIRDRDAQRQRFRELLDSSGKKSTF